MSLPAPLSSLAFQAGRVAQSAGRTVALYAVLALAGLTGVGFLLAALFIWLAALTNPLVAALVMGASLLGITGIAFGIMQARAQRVRAQRRQATVNTAMLASSLSLADAGLRIVSRARGPLFWPAAATLLATWYFTRGRSDQD